MQGRRADGYHELDSLVAFADLGDFVSVSAAANITLEVDGPFAKSLVNQSNNLALKAVAALRSHCQLRNTPISGAHIQLTKNLPIASGIGGGSADAAATLRALAKLNDLHLTPPEIEQICRPLGADVLVCFKSTAQRMCGIGEILEPIQNLPNFPSILINPLIEISTQQIFDSISKSDNAPLEAFPCNAEQSIWFDWLARQRNDLSIAAEKICPQITELLQALSDSGAETARLSGSGATCFGLFETTIQRDHAEAQLVKRFPQYWVKPAFI